MKWFSLNLRPLIRHAFLNNYNTSVPSDFSCNFTIEWCMHSTRKISFFLSASIFIPFSLIPSFNCNQMKRKFEWNNEPYNHLFFLLNSVNGGPHSVAFNNHLQALSFCVVRCPTPFACPLPIGARRCFDKANEWIFTAGHIEMNIGIHKNPFSHISSSSFMLIFLATTGYIFPDLLLCSAAGYSIFPRQIFFNKQLHYDCFNLIL